jgi:phage repressor protein C with HTH and peptisase S24 domain
MLTHAQIWAAIDALAQRQGLSISSLAKRAGLDPTTFNRSKRVNPDGQARWPSTESIAKVLRATGTGVDDFLGLVTGEGIVGRNIPFRRMEPSFTGAFGDDGTPASSAWEEIAFPGRSTDQLFALEIRGESFSPTYADGDILVVSREAPTRRGDRVFVLGADGTASIAVLGHQMTSHIQLETLSGEALPARPVEGVRAVWRILWASQ